MTEDCWVDRKGKVYKVPKAGHFQVAVELLDESEPDWHEKCDCNSTLYLEEKGWLRVSFGVPYYDFSSGPMSKKQSDWLYNNFMLKEKASKILQKVADIFIKQAEVLENSNIFKMRDDILEE